jgi:hypothetical protein
MRRYLAGASPEAFFLASAVLGAAIAAIVSRISWPGMSFLKTWLILLSADVVIYIAMKAGWMRTPRQRSGREF